MTKKLKYSLGKMSLLMFPLTLLYFISITKKTFPKHELSFLQNSETNVYPVSLNDTLPSASILAMGAIEKKGIMIKSSTGFFTAFYEYEADHDKVLLEISQLPCIRDNNVSDLKCLFVESWKALQSNYLSKKDAEKASFYLAANADQYVAFECRKSPIKHTLLLDTRSRKVLHKVELINI